MIKFILIIFLVINPITDFNDIAKMNTLKKEAREAFNNGEFETAINKYTVLMQEYQQTDPNMLLNLSHSYYNTGNMEEAEKAYKPLIASSDMNVRSIANQQLGNMASAKEDYKTALNYYKAALKAAPDNEEARYNYELTKKLLDEQKEQQENEDGEEEKQNEQEQEEQGEEEKKEQEEGSESEEENQEKGEEENEEQSEAEKQEGEAENETEQENQDPQQQEQNEKDQRMEDMQSLKEKLEELNMNEQTAMMILEALKNQEIQYIQQKRRQTNQPKKSGKPDW